MAKEYDREWHCNEAVLTDFSPCHNVHLDSVSKIIEAPIALLEIGHVSITNLDGVSSISLKPMSRNHYYHVNVVYWKCEAATSLLVAFAKLRQATINFLISNFRHVLNVVRFLLGNSPAPEFYMPTFRNTLFHLYRQVGVKNELGLRKVGVFIREKVWLENSLSQ